MNKRDSLDALVVYLEDNGLDEGEIDHFLKEKIFKGKSLMDYVRENDWKTTWFYANRYIAGETW